MVNCRTVTVVVIENCRKYARSMITSCSRVCVYTVERLKFGDGVFVQPLNVSRRDPLSYHHSNTIVKQQWPCYIVMATVIVVLSRHLSNYYSLPSIKQLLFYVVPQASDNQSLILGVLPPGFNINCRTAPQYTTLCPQM